MNVALVCVLGVSVVFIGLICIVILCKIMSILVTMSEKNGKSAGTENTPAASPAVSPAVSKASPDPGPRGEIVAAIAAVLAEELGEDVSAIRILSLKKIN